MIVHYDVFGNATPEWINEANQMERDFNVSSLEEVAVLLVNECIGRRMADAAADGRGLPVMDGAGTPVEDVKARVRMPYLFCK